MVQAHGVVRLGAFNLMSITPQFRLCSTVRPFISVLQAGLFFLSLCLWRTAVSAQELQNITLVEHNIESPPFVEGQSIDGIEGFTTDFSTRPLVFTDRTNDATSVLFGLTSGAITTGSGNNGTGGTFADITIPEEARTLTINLSGRFRSATGFGALIRLFSTEGPNFILSLGGSLFTDDPLPTFITGTDFEFDRVNLNSEDQHSQFAHRSLDLTLFYDQRTGEGTVTANNLEGDRLPTVITEFTDTFLVSELGTLGGDVFVADSNDAISAFNVQVGAVSSVPEPSSSTALAFLSLLVLGRRRRK